MLRVDTTYLTTAQLAVRWKKSAYTICEYAKQGRIDGAVRDGNEWRFPEEAILKPAKAIVGAGRAVKPLDSARAKLEQMKKKARDVGHHV